MSQIEGQGKDDTFNEEEFKESSPTDYTSSIAISRLSATEAEPTAKGCIAEEAEVRVPTKLNLFSEQKPQKYPSGKIQVDYSK